MIRGDAGRGGLQPESADAVIWDPPIYDNVDYAVLAQPHELILGKLRTVEPEQGQVPASETLPQVSNAVTGGDGVEVHGRPKFDRAQYETALRDQAAQARLLLRPGGRLGVFWPVRDPSGLQAFLDIVAPTGFELFQAVRLATPDTSPGSVATYVLLFDLVGKAARSTKSHVNAGRVFDLTDRGAPSLYNGLADILLKYWNEDDFLGFVSPDSKGSERQRVAAGIAIYPAPEDLLLELGRPALRGVLDELSLTGMSRNDARAMSRDVLRALGFTVPEPPGFSIGANIQEASLAAHRLPLSMSHEDARGTLLTVITLVERVLRFADVAWAMAAAEDRWAEVIDDVVRKTSGKNFEGPASMTIGDWKNCFCRIPATLREHGIRGELFGPVASALSKKKADQKLGRLVRLRNQIGHDDIDLSTQPIATYIRETSSVCQSAIQLLIELVRDARLPITLQPLEEIRDHYGRRRLVLADAFGSRVELFVQKDIDLERPLVYLPSASNLRDVDPTFVDGDLLEGVLRLGAAN
ncbi:hypothetical protein ACFOW4_13285 [Micromonospora sp. GCM10011542]|uniref:hypothetical protein n=1 Tax=Micromonospora sp. GCM10011542 TaxID=3317337 RepID=UPI003614D7EC